METITACFRFRPIVVKHPGKECCFFKYLFLFFVNGIVLMEYIYSLINKDIITFMPKCSVDLHVKSSSVQGQIAETKTCLKSPKSPSDLPAQNAKRTNTMKQIHYESFSTKGFHNLSSDHYPLCLSKPVISLCSNIKVFCCSHHFPTHWCPSFLILKSFRKDIFPHLTGPLMHTCSCKQLYFAQIYLKRYLKSSS